ncbi:MAG: UDP-3-O-acyl-N-acetylglucosamine deacetylase, partial [Kiritimatiellae bacterium]|nr:UDP-3-O-acyl-N-acetylglucosamine deacetylase [Kiritimatiellia bacterium]
MAGPEYGRILEGEKDRISAAYERWTSQPVDLSLPSDDVPQPPLRQRTLAGVAVVAGPGTFFRRAQRVLRFEPGRNQGWYFKRQDLQGALPIEVSAKNVWTAVRNIVLCSGSPHNYMRMVEHIVA